MLKEAKIGGKGRVYASTKRETTDHIAWLARAAKLRPMKRVQVSLEWREVTKARNPDNIRAGIKFVLDGLVVAGILANDGWSEIAGFTDTWLVHKTQPGVLVTLTEVE